ncbi:unnamed protein product [Hapterophycus canaliculatus]
MNTHMRRPPSPAVRLSAKVLFRRFSGRLGYEQASKIDTLMSHNDRRQLSSARLMDGDPDDISDNDRISSSTCRNWSAQDEEDCIQARQEVARLAAGMAHGAVVADAAGHSLPLVSDGLGKEASLLDLARKELRRVCMNAITTCDGSGATGLGLCPSGAMFNHSCTPNCQVWWRGSKLEIRCTKPVDKGEELCFSYIHIDQPSAVRQAQLRRSWFFTCRCRRCASQEWDTELAGLRCPETMCTGAVPPPRTSAGGAFCNRCGSSAFVGAQRYPHAPGAGEKREDDGVVERSGTSTGATGKSCFEQGLTLIGERVRAQDDEDEWSFLAEADRFFEDGVEAYMREDPEVALVALEKSLLVRERILHPFNKVLLRTLRYGSMAAIATKSWGKAHSFLSRWLHPMDKMFGAAEVWDIAAMRIDDGLVLEQLSATTTETPIALLMETIPQSRIPTSVQSEAVVAGGLHPAAYRELVEGLRYLWICLGRETGLPAETAALEVCAEHGINI